MYTREDHARLRLYDSIYGVHNVCDRSAAIQDFHYRGEGRGDSESSSSEDHRAVAYEIPVGKDGNIIFSDEQPE